MESCIKSHKLVTCVPRNRTLGLCSETQPSVKYSIRKTVTQDERGKAKRFWMLQSNSVLELKTESCNWGWEKLTQLPKTRRTKRHSGQGQDGFDCLNLGPYQNIFCMLGILLFRCHQR